MTTGDEQVKLDDQTGLDRVGEAMLPASIKKEHKQIKFRFLKYEKLPKMDTFGTIDAFVKMDYFKKKLKTKVVT